jgi:thioredoxin-like negative regulator of GroEL
MIEHLDDKTYNEVLGQERVAVVKVGAAWCGPCKFIEPHFRKWTRELSNVNGIDIPYYNVDNDKCGSFLNQHRVRILPTILIMVHGATIYKIEGVTRQSVVEGFIKKALRVKVEYNNG